MSLTAEPAVLIGKTRVLGGITVIDTPFITRAMEYARSHSEPFLFNHAVRSWLFAVRLGQLQSMAHDAEVVAVGCLLHDLGLTNNFTGPERFEIEGANAARAFAASLQWSVPPVLPPGALIAVVSGDPTGPGEFTLLVSMPDGYRLPPHFHPSDEHVEVREGALLVGTGDVLDPKRTQALVAGDSATGPGGNAPFLDRPWTDGRVRDVHGPFCYYVPPRRGRSAATHLPLRLLN
jgi:quercetin dioxygenase-like cupin family protein